MICMELLGINSEIAVQVVGVVVVVVVVIATGVNHVDVVGANIEG